jgi:hypothetical protein
MSPLPSGVGSLHTDILPNSIPISTDTTQFVLAGLLPARGLAAPQTLNNPGGAQLLQIRPYPIQSHARAFPLNVGNPEWTEHASDRPQHEFGL